MSGKRHLDKGVAGAGRPSSLLARHLEHLRNDHADTPASWGTTIYVNDAAC